MNNPVGAATDVNAAYYGAESAGRLDYWRKMAAPRARMATALRFIAERNPRRLIDIGCGSGLVLAEISRGSPGVELAGADLSETQIQANRRSHHDIEWLAADVQAKGAFSELRGGFDAIIALELIEHLDAPDRFLENVRDLVDPEDGWLFLSTQSGKLRQTEEAVGHVRHFSVADMGRALERTGWRPERVWNEGFPFHDLSKWYANLDPERSLQSFGGDRYGPKQDAICAALRLAFRLNSRRRGAQLYALARPA